MGSWESESRERGDGGETGNGRRRGDRETGDAERGWGKTQKYATDRGESDRGGGAGNWKAYIQFQLDRRPRPVYVIRLI